MREEIEYPQPAYGRPNAGRYPVQSGGNPNGFDGNDLLQILGHLSINLGKHVEESVSFRKKLQEQARKVATANWYHNQDNVIIPANGFGVVRLTGPDQGHIWNVRTIVAGGVTSATTAAGTADVFVSASDLRIHTAIAGNIPISNWRDHAAALPAVLHESNGEIILRFNEELYVCFSAATATQEYVAACHVIDLEEGAMRQEFTV